MITTPQVEQQPVHCRLGLSVRLGIFRFTLLPPGLLPVPQGLEACGGVPVVGAHHGVEPGGGGGLVTLANASCRWSSETWS